MILHLHSDHVSLRFIFFISEPLSQVFRKYVYQIRRVEFSEYKVKVKTYALRFLKHVHLRQECDCNATVVGSIPT